jgi:hypothetical protein
VPLQDLEGAFLLQGPVAGQGHAWLLPVGRGMFRIASFTARSWSAVMAQQTPFASKAWTIRDN